MPPEFIEKLVEGFYPVAEPILDANIIDYASKGGTALGNSAATDGKAWTTEGAEKIALAFRTFADAVDGALAANASAGPAV